MIQNRPKPKTRKRQAVGKLIPVPQTPEAKEFSPQLGRREKPRIRKPVLRPNPKV